MLRKATVVLSLIGFLLLGELSAQKCIDLKSRNESKFAGNTVILAPTAITIDGDRWLYVQSTVGDGKLYRIALDTLRVSVFAGNGDEVSNGDGGSAVAAGIGSPNGLAVTKRGELVIAQQQGRIRIVRKSGQIVTIAGNGELGRNAEGDGGLAIQAKFRSPSSIAIDRNGNIFVSDSLDHRVRRVDAITKKITTYAGGGSGDLGDGGPAIKATLKFPYGIVFDSADNLYIADREHHRIRRVDATTGVITTVVGNGESEGAVAREIPRRTAFPYPTNIAINNKDHLFVVRDMSIYEIDLRKEVMKSYFDGEAINKDVDGELMRTGGISEITGIAFDSNNNLYFSDYVRERVMRIDAASRNVTTIVGSCETQTTGRLSSIFLKRGEIR